MGDTIWVTSSWEMKRVEETTQQKTTDSNRDVDVT